MKFSVEQDGDAVIINVGGSLTFHDYKEWRQVQDQVISTDFQCHIVDLTNLENIDSAGLGMLLTMKKMVDDKLAKMFIRHIGTGEVKTMLEKSNFGALIPFYDD